MKNRLINKNKIYLKKKGGKKKEKEVLQDFSDSNSANKIL